jgi:hypothetical protein
MMLTKEILMEHYYGDIVRRLFLASAAVMLITYPFLSDLIPETPIFSIFAIVMIIMFAGLTNPRQVWVSVANMIISGAGLLIFGFYAVQFYAAYTAGSALFWVNQILVILFLLAFYFSVKTLRGTAV